MTDWITPLLVFVAVACAIGIVSYLVISFRRRIGKRLDNLGKTRRRRRRSSVDSDRFPTLTNMLERQGRHSAVEDWLDRAGVPWRPANSPPPRSRRSPCWRRWAGSSSARWARRSASAGGARLLGDAAGAGGTPHSGIRAPAPRCAHADGLHPAVGLWHPARHARRCARR